MNIVIVTNTYRPHHSVAARVVESYVEAYRQQGDQVLVLAPEFDGAPEEDAGTIRFPAIPDFQGSEFAASVPLTPGGTQRLKDFAPDIIHAFQPFLLGATALRIAVSYDIPLVFSHHTRYEHGYAPADSPMLQRFVAELAAGYCNLADAVIVPHSSVATVLLDRGVTSTIEVIPPGISAEPYRSADGAAIRQQLQIPSSAFVVGHIGQRSSVRDDRFISRSLREFLSRNPEAHVLLPGSVDRQQDLRDQLAGISQAARVHRLPDGDRASIPACYAAMDVLLAGATADLSGHVLLEALAAGVPVVTVDAPERRPLIEDGRNGRLLPSASPSRCVAALTGLMKMPPAERDQWSQHARATADSLSLAASAGQTRQLYARLIAASAIPKEIERSQWETIRTRIETEWAIWSKRTRAAGAGLRGERHPSRVPVLRYFYSMWRSFRRWSSRREWSVKLLDLPVSQGTADEPGLILLQIDGLARRQFEHALKKHRLPFLSRLIRKEGYRTHTMYSGLPSTTPAVLAELFYGVQQAVPAFGFRDHRSGRVVEMFHPGMAATIQHELEEQGEGLLDGGTAYSGIYSGGADESSFCPATTGWRNFEDITMWRRILLFLLNLMSLFRIACLAVIELFVSMGDAVRGIVNGREFWRELFFIPRRIIVNVGLRELIAIGVEADVTRGVRAIHANFLGYDENSHRRGPDALFAHFTLRGIDRAIHRIWNAAHASGRRDYHLWIMSDHGQQHTKPYTHEYGRKLGDAVTAFYRRYTESQAAPAADCQHQSQEQPQNELRRANWLFGKSQGQEAVFSWLQSERNEHEPTTVGIGPLGYLYWPDQLESAAYDRIAAGLLNEVGIPLILADVEGTVWAWNAAGRFRMPDEVSSILPADHPHLEQVAADLTSLCRHPDAGEFMLSGWRSGQLPISFVPENGAHGGPGPDETSGFILVPPDAPLPDLTTSKLRPCELRQMGLRTLRRQASPRHAAGRESRTFRLATYNVHSCIGLDGRLSPRRIARVLAAATPDIVALQELDVGRRRSEFVDQAAQIAEALDMQLHFHSSFQVEEEEYGNAILSRFPLQLKQAGGLPGSSPGQEPRGALWVEIDIEGTSLQVINTHLGLSPGERMRQVEELLGAEWLSHPDCTSPVILCGDFNAGPRSRMYDEITRKLYDVQLAVEGHKPQRTWFSRAPIRRIDHVFADRSLHVSQVSVPRTRLAKTASDHSPLIVDFELETAETPHHASAGVEERNPASVS